MMEKAGPCGLPKDRLEPGESERQAALREMWEECGVEAALLPGFRREVSYAVGCGQGRQLLSGQVRSPAAPQRGAVAESLLLAYAQELERLIHGYSKPVLRAAEACLTQKTAKPCRHLAASGKFVR